MFFKKKTPKNLLPKPEPDVHVISIPDVFYGGKDPEIYHAPSGDVGSKKDAKQMQTRNFQSGAGQKSFLSKKSTWIIGGTVFVVVISGISWYYVRGYMNARLVTNTEENTQTNGAPPTSIPSIVVPTSTAEIVENQTPTSTQPVEIPTTTLDAANIQFPVVTLIDSADVDSDELTDAEEEFFGTDSGTWDTDKDSFYDGQEVFNLYNPRGFAPIKIIDSGVIQEYANPFVGYRVYYPKGWQKGAVDVKESQVLFSALLGDYIEIRVFEKDPVIDFTTWFGRNAEGQQFTDLVKITNRFKEEGWKRKDNLVAYFISPTRVYVFVYHSSERGPIEYRHIIQMMYQSFRMQKSDIDIPDQILPPGMTTSTTTSTVNTDILVTSTPNNTVTSSTSVNL
ncbi:MAG: hypothetical protein WCW16_04320 [Candidatus Magasanikbacteria bacterium]